MKHCKKVIALLLALALCLGAAPFSSLAYEAGEVVSEPEEAADPLLVHQQNGGVVSEPEEFPQREEPSQSDEERTPLFASPNTASPTAGDQAAEAETLIGPEGEGAVLMEMDLSENTANGIQAFAATRSSTLSIGWTTIGSNTGSLPSIGDSLTQCPTKMTLENGVYTAAYCLDIHLGATGGHGYTEGAAAIADKNKLSLIGDILAQGYQYSGASKMPYGDRTKWLVTQMYIWAAVNGTIRRDPATGWNVFDHSVISDTGKIASCCGDYSGYYSYACTLQDKLEKMRKIPSFAKSEDDAATKNPAVLSAKADGSFSTVLTDTNKVLDHFNFNFGGVASSSKSGNKLTLTANAPIEDAVVSQEAKYQVEGGEKSVVCWKPADPSQQRFLTSNPQPDPVSAYLAVRTGEGEAPEEPEPTEQQWRATVRKQDTETGTAQGDAGLAGAVYGVYLNGSLLDAYVTNSNGSFTTSYYDCGSGYTLREISPSTGYLLNSQSVSIGTSGDDSDTELFQLSYTVKEQVKKGTIRLTKHTDKGETGIETPEEGAEFQVYLSSAGSYETAKASERDVLTIDKNGLAASKALPYGLYTVHQTKGWEGKDLVADFSVFVEEDGQVYAFILNNRVYESLITVIKRDAETGRVIPASGIGFKVRNTDTGEYVVQHINYPTPQDLSIFYTDVTGKLMLPSVLEYGSYELIEVATAYGYVLDSDPVPFSVDGTAKEVTVEKRNVPQKGRIKIHKQGEGFLSVSMENGLYSPIYGPVGLSGAEFSITAAEDIYTPDGALRFTAGEEVDTLTTDSLGECTSISLYLGKYLVSETLAPEGYVRDRTWKLVELSYAGQAYELTSADVTVTDQRQKAIVDVLKELEQDEVFHVGTGNEYENVVFGLYAAKELKAADGSVIPIDGLLGMATVGSDGRARFTADVPCGASLYLKEISTDPHYVLSEEKWPVEFTYAGQDVSVVFLHANSAHRVQNTLKRGTIAGSKSDEDGLLLAGAVMGLFFPDETAFTKETAVLTSTSAANGDFAFENVPYGSWIVREIKPPDGFVLNETSYPVTVQEDGQRVTVAIENKFIRGGVRLEKIDAEYTGKKLYGAKFDLYADSNGNQEFDAGDVKAGTLLESESEKGVYTLEGLRYGSYFAVEATAPDYYELDPTPRYFAIQEEGAVVSLVAKNSPQLGSLLIKKTAEDGLMKGIRFTVSGSPYTGGTYQEEFETDENGEIHITGLRVGEYTVSEVTDESTVRYVIPEDQTVTITYGDTAELSFYNELRRGSVYVTKTAVGDPDSKLTGAKFKVYRDVDFNREFDSDVDAFYADLEADNGVYWLEGLPIGGFFLHESIAPKGCAPDQEYYYFEIQEDTRQIEITNTEDPKAGFVNRPITGSLKIVKKAAGSEALLEGVNFCVKNAAGEVVAEGTTDRNGVVTFDRLKAGSYTYQEIYARSGYELDDTEFPFQIEKDGQVVERVMRNTRTPFYVPQTGDGRPNPGFYFLALGVGVAGLSAVGGFSLFRKWNKRKNSKGGKAE